MAIILPFGNNPRILGQNIVNERANFMTTNLPVYGYMRFSYLGKSDARLSRLVSGQEQFDLMYHPDRMAQRFYVFEHIALPSYRSQVFEDWRLDILISKAMPDIYKSRLRDLVADVPQIAIVESDAETANHAFNSIIKERCDNATERTIHFRSDDDDALSMHALKILNEHRYMSPKQALITMPSGLFLHTDGTEVNLLRKFEPNIAIGWALVNEPGTFRNPYNFIHGGYALQARSVTLPDFPAYIHCAYESCDTQPAQDKKLAHARAFDRNHGTPQSRIDISHVLSRHFSWATYDGLIDVFSKIPKGHKTAVWVQ